MNTKHLLRLTVLLAILTIVGVIAASLFHALQTPPYKTTVLSDGSRMTLLGATLGGQQFTTDKPWQNKARRWLPRKWQGWLPDTLSQASSGDTNTLTVWFTLLDSRGANVTTSPWTWFQPLDDTGFAFPLFGGSGSSSSGRLTVHNLRLQAYPRRQAEFNLRFLDNIGCQVGSIPVPNPFHGPFAEWTPQHLPITATNGPLVVTLDQLTERSNAAPPYASWISVRWKLQTEDPLWRGAQPSYQQWADATGNLGAYLSYEERVWKLQLPFRRPNPASYTEDEKFSLPGLTVPKPGSFQILSNECERLGVRFKILCLVGGGSLALTNGTHFGMDSKSSGGGNYGSWGSGLETVETWSHPYPFFLIESSDPGPLDELRFRALRSDGSEIKVDSSGSYNTVPGGHRYQLRLDCTNTPDSICLEGIVSRTRMIEFLVDPKEIRRQNR